MIARKWPEGYEEVERDHRNLGRKMTYGNRMLETSLWKRKRVLLLEYRAAMRGKTRVEKDIYRRLLALELGLIGHDYRFSVHSSSLESLAYR